jgi:hypothetical protein
MPDEAEAVDVVPRYRIETIDMKSNLPELLLALPLHRVVWGSSGIAVP